MFFQFTASYEADLYLFSQSFDVDVFQFTASYEADLLLIAILSSHIVFQFTASYEADLYCAGNNRYERYLSIHSLIRG